METYRVTAPSAVFGHEPGTVFERDIPDEQEAQLIASGAIAKSRAKTVDVVDRTTTKKAGE
jgi:hypothetical protein